MNAAWHRENPMPRRATQAQRVEWHLRHAEACACRPVPESLRAEVERLRRAVEKEERSPRPSH